MAGDDDLILKEYGRVDIGKTRHIRVFAANWKKRKSLHIRVFYLDKESEEFLPGKGVTIGERDIVGFKKILREFIRDHETFSILTDADTS